MGAHVSEYGRKAGGQAALHRRLLSVWWMAWGKKSADDLLTKLASGTPTLYVMPFRSFGPVDAVKFAEKLASNTTLLEFYSSGKDIGLEGARAFGDCLKSNTTLTSLCIGDAAFGDESASALVDGLRFNSGLERLDLENKSLTAAGAVAVGSVLSVHPTMHTLLLSRNPIGADGLLALLEAVAPRGAGCPLQVLALANCEIGVPVVSPLRAWLSTPGLRLHTLDLSGNAIGSGDASAELALGLAGAPTLITLTLAGCDLQAGFLAAFVTSTLSSEAVHLLESLSLADNPALGPASLTELATVVAASERVVFPGLHTLCLSNCGLSDESIAILATSVPSLCPSLKTLDVASNKLSCEAIPHLVSVARTAHTLRLFDNCIADKGVSELLEAVLSPAAAAAADDAAADEASSIRAACSVRYIDLGGNSVTDAGALEIAALLKRVRADRATEAAASAVSSFLETLELVANAITEAGEATLQQLIDDGDHCGIDIVFQRRAGGDK